MRIVVIGSGSIFLYPQDGYRCSAVAAAAFMRDCAWWISTRANASRWGDFCQKINEANQGDVKISWTTDRFGGLARGGLCGALFCDPQLPLPGGGHQPGEDVWDSPDFRRNGRAKRGVSAFCVRYRRC